MVIICSDCKGVNMSSLNNKQREDFRNALIDAFPEPENLAQMVQFKSNEFRLNESLNVISPTKEDLNIVVDQLIEACENQGKTLELIAAGRSANPSNPELQKVAQDFDLAPKLSPETTERLETVIQASSDIRDISEWLELLGGAEAHICQIEIPNSDPGSREIDPFVKGTAFLVGPSLIMTNYHVVQDVEYVDPFEENLDFVEKGFIDSSKIILRFDYKKANDGTEFLGKEYRLEQDWLVACNVELDYALLKSSGNPGKELLDGRSVERGWFKSQDTPTKPYDFRPESIVFIIQHNGKPMQIASGPLIGLDENGIMAKYKTPTNSGASGAAVTNFQLNLIALHSQAVANRDGTYNMGTRFKLIMEDLERKGYRDLIG